MRRTVQVMLMLVAVPACAAGQSWSALGTGVDGPVYALAEYGNELYVGGDFTSAGGTGASYIARWNGVTWSPVGSGTNAAVRSLLVYEGRLYAGGEFTSCGGVECPYVARWDGTRWEPVGSALNGPVFSMAVYQRTVFIGGSFTMIGLGVANRLAVWEGDDWRAVFGGVNDTVYALKVTAFGELFADLYVGGSFAVADIRRIAWYHPAYQTLLATEWAGFNAPVLAFENYAGGLIAGGSFTSSGVGSRTSYLAQKGREFNGGTDGCVHALHADGSLLFVGGCFLKAGPAPGVDAAHIASWDGVGWSALGSGTKGSVRALTMFQGQLHAGGDFDSAGGIRVGHLARWGTTSGIAAVPESVPTSIRLLQNYPNPFNSATTIEYVPAAAANLRVSVYDMLGREVSVLVDGRREAGVHSVVFDGSRFPTGVYVCRLRAGDFVESRRLHLVR